MINRTTGGKKYLAIRINTVPRRGDPDSLRRTVHALLDNLPEDEEDPLYGRVTIAIMNCGEPGKHKVYYEVKEELVKKEKDLKHQKFGRSLIIC